MRPEDVSLDPGWLAAYIEAFARHPEAAVFGGRILPELTVDHADHAVWQRQRMEGPEGLAQVDYWRKTLAGMADTLDLPADRPRPPTATSSANWRSSVSRVVFVIIEQAVS